MNSELVTALQQKYDQLELKVDQNHQVHDTRLNELEAKVTSNTDDLKQRTLEIEALLERLSVGDVSSDEKTVATNRVIEKQEVAKGLAEHGENGIYAEDLLKHILHARGEHVSEGEASRKMLREVKKGLLHLRLAPVPGAVIKKDDKRKYYPC